MKQYNILDYGAIADGVTNNAAAIQQAIDEASAEGGCVVIPQGKYLSGTLVLKSNIDFHGIGLPRKASGILPAAMKSRICSPA